MQIVIDISESDKEIIDNGYRSFETGVNFYKRLIMAIQQGTLLPKGHGRLIDADSCVEYIEDTPYKNHPERDWRDKDVKSMLYADCHMVLEADKESDNANSN